MKLILTSSVAGLGEPGDVVTVKDGYGRNFLLPRNLAIKSTKGAEKQISLIRRARDARDIRDLGSAKEIATELAALKVRLATRAGREGRLFGSVGAGDIVDAVKAAGGPLLDRKRVELGGPIKSVGQHTVSVKLHPEVAATITVDVVAAE